MKIFSFFLYVFVFFVVLMMMHIIIVDNKDTLSWDFILIGTGLSLVSIFLWSLAVIMKTVLKITKIIIVTIFREFLNSLKKILNKKEKFAIDPHCVVDGDPGRHSGLRRI